MAESGAPLAGEMSGHIFFADRYYGYDDAVYVAVRLLGILARAGDEPRRHARPRCRAAFNTPELRLALRRGAQIRASSTRSRRACAGAAPRSPISTACACALPTAGGCCGRPTPRRCSSRAPKRRARPGSTASRRSWRPNSRRADCFCRRPRSGAYSLATLRPAGRTIEQANPLRRSSSQAACAPFAEKCPSRAR